MLSFFLVISIKFFNEVLAHHRIGEIISELLIRILRFFVILLQEVRIVDLIIMKSRDWNHNQEIIFHIIWIVTERDSFHFNCESNYDVVKEMYFFDCGRFKDLIRVVIQQRLQVVFEKTFLFLDKIEDAGFELEFSIGEKMLCLHFDWCISKEDSWNLLA